jgi:hypothetical protein
VTGIPVGKSRHPKRCSHRCPGSPCGATLSGLLTSTLIFTKIAIYIFGNLGCPQVENGTENALLLTFRALRVRPRGRPRRRITSGRPFQNINSRPAYGLSVARSEIAAKTGFRPPSCSVRSTTSVASASVAAECESVHEYERCHAEFVHSRARTLHSDAVHPRLGCLWKLRE